MSKVLIKTILDKTGLLKIMRAKQTADRDKRVYLEEQSVNTNVLTGARLIDHNLRMQIHILEKAFVIGNQSILRNQKMILELIEKLDALLANGYSKDSSIVKEVLSAVHGFTARCKNNETDAIQTEIASFMSRHNMTGSDSGENAIEIIGREPVAPQLLHGYKAFAQSRVSVRKCKPGLVDRDIILEIIKLANLCPSACNRQPCKVYFSVDNDKQNRLKELCGYWQDSSGMSNFMVPTVDKSAFSPNESFQAWINGGIFIDALVNAIHAYDLGACIFQFNKHYKNLSPLKSLLDIPPYEDILCIIGFGKVAEPAHIIKKHRKPVAEIAMER